MASRNPWPKRPGIYSITLVGSEDPGWRYIGHATDLRYRLSKHRTTLRGNYHFSPHLQNCWNAYGEAAFRFEILEICLGAHEILLAREQYWLDRFAGRVFNTRLIAESTKGCKLNLSDEERERRRQLLDSKRHLRPKRTNANLAEADIPAIFARYAAGEGPISLAHGFKVNVPTICDVLNRETWDDVPIDPEVEAACRARMGSMGRKVTDEEVVAIKRRIAAGERFEAIGADHGMTGTAIGYIAKGDHYAHVRVDDETEAVIAALIQSRKRTTTDEMAAEVLRRIAAGEPQCDIARSMGLSQQMVCNIKKGRCFAHVLEAFRREQESAARFPLFRSEPA